MAADIVGEPHRELQLFAMLRGRRHVIVFVVTSRNVCNNLFLPTYLQRNSNEILIDRY